MKRIDTLSWKAYYVSWNRDEIVEFNVFDHGRFKESITKNYAKYKKDKETFLEELKTDLMYYYWSKFEWEVRLFAPDSSDESIDKKIDVYKQIMLNWDVFAEYTWNTLKGIKD